MAIESGTPEWHKREAEIWGELFIKELDEPEDYRAYVRSGDDGRKYLGIYKKSTGDTRITFSAPTWYDLDHAAGFAWNMHTMMKRGF